MTNEINAELYDQIVSLPLLNTILPHVFENHHVAEGMAITCCCGHDIEMDTIRANVDYYTHTLSIKAYAICHNCDTITTVNSRFADDGTRLTQSRSGVWQRGSIDSEQKEGWFSLLMSLFIPKRS
jgi:hypothetical protein